MSTSSTPPPPPPIIGQDSLSVNEAPQAHIVDFGCGHPDPYLLPTKLVAEATVAALQSSPEWLQYGRENGNPPARQALAQFLTRLYRCNERDTNESEPTVRPVDPDTLALTSGVSHGIQLTCQALARMHHSNTATTTTTSKPLCLLDDPTYFLVPAIFQQAGYELQPVPCSPRGLDLLLLSKQFHNVRALDEHRLLVYYTIPIHHNPLGVSLSQQDRQTLVQLCERYHVHLIVDEVYQGLKFPDFQSPTPLALASPCVILVSAFTKILCPGIRCGWIQTQNKDLLRTIGQDAVLDSGGCSSQLSSGIVTHLLTRPPGIHCQSSPLEEYMTTLQTEYAKRCHHLCNLLRQASLDSSHGFAFEFQVPRGGYFLWVKLVGVHFDVNDKFQVFCRTHHNVDLKTGSSCSSANWKTTNCQFSSLPPTKSTCFSQYMRLCFAYYSVPQISMGVKRLCQAIRAYSEQSP